MGIGQKWKVVSEPAPAADSGLEVEDELTVSGAGIWVERPSESRSFWWCQCAIETETKDSDTVYRPDQRTGAKQYTITDNQKGKLTCKDENGFDSGTTWTATAEDGETCAPPGKEKKPKQA